MIGKYYNDFGHAVPNQFISANDLPDAIRKVDDALKRQGEGRRIGVLSPNATPHNITTDVVDAMAEVGAHAVIGAANNMLTLDENGSYKGVADRAVAKKVFVPHDSAINMMGAASVIFRAVGVIREDGTIDEAKMKALVGIVGKRVKEEYEKAHLQGIPPQLWRDTQAMIWWNAEVDAGRAVGGKFEIPDLSGYTPPSPTGGNDPWGDNSPSPPLNLRGGVTQGGNGGECESDKGKG